MSTAKRAKSRNASPMQTQTPESRQREFLKAPWDARFVLQRLEDTAPPPLLRSSQRAVSKSPPRDHATSSSLNQSEVLEMREKREKAKRLREQQDANVARKKENGFSLSTDTDPPPAYNALRDQNLRGYFERSSVRNFLTHQCLINEDGAILPVETSGASLNIVEQELSAMTQEEARRRREDQFEWHRLEAKYTEHAKLQRKRIAIAEGVRSRQPKRPPGTVGSVSVRAKTSSLRSTTRPVSSSESMGSPPPIAAGERPSCTSSPSFPATAKNGRSSTAPLPPPQSSVSTPPPPPLFPPL